jgi:hypothetical protein
MAASLTRCIFEEFFTFLWKINEQHRLRPVSSFLLLIRSICRNAYEILLGKPEEKKPLGRSRCRWEGNIKINLKETCGERVGWIELAQDGNCYLLLRERKIY